jgi:hypothetical protein
MLRPTLNELISGFQNTIMQTMLPELTSPYAQAQAMAMVGMMMAAASWN